MAIIEPPAEPTRSAPDASGSDGWIEPRTRSAAVERAFELATQVAMNLRRIALADRDAYTAREMTRPSPTASE